jgi:hypothetical protein
MIAKIKDACEACIQTNFLSRAAFAASDAAKLQGLKNDLTRAQLRFIVSAWDAPGV